ncbi:MAG TPA: hypothetical protein VKQ52_18795, partial [Puia sp.]|nr:hypothetical protein [Puia sp.]
VPEPLAFFIHFGIKLLCSSAMIALFIVHVITGQLLRLLGYGFLSFLLLVLCVAAPFYLLHLKGTLILAATIGTVLHLVVLLVLYHYRKREGRSEEKAFVVLSLPYVLFYYLIIIGKEIDNAVFYVTATCCLPFFIRWYWAYSFRPRAIN